MLSIKKINYVILTAITLVNILFYIILYFSLKVDSIYFLAGFFNIFILCIYYYLYQWYEKEIQEEGENVKKLIKNNSFANNDEIKQILSKKMIYSENNDNHNLFKNMYIRKNILLKDYSDLEKLFSKLLPKRLIEEVGDTGIEQLHLGSSIKKELTVMFLDIIGFTTIAEKFSPEKALLLLNLYFDGIVEIIKNNGGYVDKFLGDGIMIIFESEYSDVAIQTSLEIQRFIHKFQISNIGKKLSVGIGINSGEVIMGTIGSKNRMEVSIIGDVVNIASRVESVTRKYKENIIISQNTYNKIQKKDNFKFRNLGLKFLKGKKNKIIIYGVGEK